MSGLLSRAELPKWMRPLNDLPAKFSVFHGTVIRPARIREYTFIVDRDGLVRFEEEALHTPTSAIVDSAPVSHIPPEVLIAAGVEAIRRHRGRS
jgi:hypothetical protein